jgi:site-specific recombinase XerC
LVSASGNPRVFGDAVQTSASLIPRLTPSYFSAGQALENGADVRFVQAKLSHESLETTQVYSVDPKAEGNQ